MAVRKAYERIQVQNDDYIYSFYEYKECYADKELDDLFLIREDDGEWREPLVEVEE